MHAPAEREATVLCVRASLACVLYIYVVAHVHIHHVVVHVILGSMYACSERNNNSLCKEHVLHTCSSTCTSLDLCIMLLCVLRKKHMYSVGGFWFGMHIVG